jgi:hypothetical protein
MDIVKRLLSRLSGMISSFSSKLSVMGRMIYIPVLVLCIFIAINVAASFRPIEGFSRIYDLAKLRGYQTITYQYCEDKILSHKQLPELFENPTRADELSADWRTGGGDGRSDNWFDHLGSNGNMLYSPWVHPIASLPWSDYKGVNPYYFATKLPSNYSFGYRLPLVNYLTRNNDDLDLGVYYLGKETFIKGHYYALRPYRDRSFHQNCTFKGHDTGEGFPRVTWDDYCENHKVGVFVRKYEALPKRKFINVDYEYNNFSLLFSTLSRSPTYSIFNGRPVKYLVQEYEKMANYFPGLALEFKDVRREILGLGSYSSTGSSYFVGWAYDGGLIINYLGALCSYIFIPIGLPILLLTIIPFYSSRLLAFLINTIISWVMAGNN